MLRLCQYLLLVGIAILAITKHIPNFKYLLNLFFNHKKFIDLAIEETIKTKSNTEKIETLEEQFSESTQKLKNSIYEAFWTVLRTLGFAWLIACVITNSIFNPFYLPLILQIVSAFFILWALVGKLGYPIRTWNGNTLPERIDNFWFIFLNVIGILLLFSIQFYSFYKINPTVNNCLEIRMITLEAWAIGLLICVLMGNYLVRIIVKNSRTEPLAPLTLPLGFLEILSYAVSYIMGFPGFITIWLALKTAGRWKAHKTPQHITNSFLLGNLVSVFIGVYLGAIFRSCLVNMGLMEIFKKYFLP